MKATCDCGAEWKHSCSEEQLLNDEHILKRKKMFGKKKTEEINIDFLDGLTGHDQNSIYHLESKLNEVIREINSDHSE